MWRVAAGCILHTTYTKWKWGNTLFVISSIAIYQSNGQLTKKKRKQWNNKKKNKKKKTIMINNHCAFTANVSITHIKFFFSFCAVHYIHIHIPNVLLHYYIHVYEVHVYTYVLDMYMHMLGISIRSTSI